MTPISDLIMGGVIVALVGGTTVAWAAFAALVVFELVLAPAYRAGIRVKQEQERPPNE